MIEKGKDADSCKIKMNAESDKVKFSLKGTGIAMVDFGDGSENFSLPIDEDDWTEFYREYPEEAFRAITVQGENITELDCSENQLTSLDVSKNSVLTEFKHDDDLKVVR